MTLTDGDIAALADQAAARLDERVEVRIDPDAGDDPYRWGKHSWVVHFAAGADGARTAAVRIAADDSEQAAAERLNEAVDRLGDAAPA